MPGHRLQKRPASTQWANQAPLRFAKFVIKKWHGGPWENTLAQFFATLRRWALGGAGAEHQRLYMALALWEILLQLCSPHPHFFFGVAIPLSSFRLGAITLNQKNLTSLF